MPASYERKISRLNQLAHEAEHRYNLAKQAAARQGAPAAVRRKCFISYHGADIDGVSMFVEQFNDVFIPRVIGASESDHFKDPVDSDDEEYIKQQIGARYLADSTVTILYVGACAWARKYIDWEVASSLRNSPVNRRSGLMAITPADQSVNTLPDRFADNLADDDSKYARYYYYPASEPSLRGWIEDAVQARTSRAHLVDNRRRLRQRNSPC